MACANWMLTIFSFVILFVSFWPNLFGHAVNYWITVLSAILILIIAWTMVDCKACKKMPSNPKKKK